MKKVTINVPEGFELKQDGNTYTVVEKGFTLELGKDYVNKYYNSHIVIERAGDSNNRGFIFGKFLDDMPCFEPEYWRLATEKEVREAFEEECVRRYGKDWKDVKIKNHANCMDECLNIGKCAVYIGKSSTHGWAVWNRNGLLYADGKWAEVKEEPVFAKSLKEIERPYYTDSHGNIKSVSSSEYDTDNHLPTEELAEAVQALIKLLSFRQDVWDKEGKPEQDVSFDIVPRGGELSVRESYRTLTAIMRFKTKESAKYFLETHRALIMEYITKINN